MMLLSLLLTSGAIASEVKSPAEIDLNAIERSYAAQLGGQQDQNISQVNQVDNQQNPVNMQSPTPQLAGNVQQQQPPPPLQANNQPPPQVISQETSQVNQAQTAKPPQPKMFFDSLSTAASSAASGVNSVAQTAGRETSLLVKEVLPEIKPLLKERAKMAILGEDNYRQLYRSRYGRRYHPRYYGGNGYNALPAYNMANSSPSYHTGGTAGYYSPYTAPSYNTYSAYNNAYNQRSTQPAFGYTQPPANPYASTYPGYVAPYYNPVSTVNTSAPVAEKATNLQTSCTMPGFTQQPPSTTPKPAASNPFSMLYQMIFGSGDTAQNAATSVNLRATPDNVTSVSSGSTITATNQLSPPPTLTQELVNRNKRFQFPAILTEPLPPPKDSLYGRTPIFD